MAASIVPANRHNIRSDDKQLIGPAPNADSDHESDGNQFLHDGKIGPTGHAKLWTMLSRYATFAGNRAAGL